MASPTSPRPAAPAAGPGAPSVADQVRARKLLLAATVLVVLGSFLPWVSTAVGNVPGYRGGGLWTFYTAMLGFTGAFLPWVRVAAVQAGLLALVALALPAWQVVHVLRLVGTGGWLPGTGLVMVVLGGILAAVAARKLALAAP